ncbi:MAG: rhodanese-like domain-containing protein [Saprospiraceae bacterium]|nr:rhodanese-like domain-containing protein [Saprospiraceae bacterium]
MGCSQKKNSGANTSVSPPTSEQTFFKDIDVNTTGKLMKEKSELIILDVRTPAETARGIIKGAIEIDYYDPTFKEKVSRLDKNQEYLVYCAVGGRSSSALSVMKEAGFTKVYNLKGGYTAWSQVNK